MADILDSEQLKRNILSDMRVELTEEFDKNFLRKAFFTDKRKKRANPNAKGTLLMVTGTMRLAKSRAYMDLVSVGKVVVI